MTKGEKRMFSFTYFDFDRTNDIADLLTSCDATIEFTETGYGDEVEGTVTAPTREKLVKFISEYEYFTCSQYPNEDDLEEINEQIEEL